MSAAAETTSKGLGLREADSAAKLKHGSHSLTGHGGQRKQCCLKFSPP